MAAPVVVPSAPRTTSGNSGTLVPIPNDTLSLIVDVTAVAGTSPTLALEVEWSADDGTTWASAETADTFTQLTAAGAVAKTFDVKTDTYRIVWTIGGTSPSFTFSIRQHT